MWRGKYPKQKEKGKEKNKIKREEGGKTRKNPPSLARVCVWRGGLAPLFSPSPAGRWPVTAVPVGGPPVASEQRGQKKKERERERETERDNRTSREERLGQRQGDSGTGDGKVRRRRHVDGRPRVGSGRNQPRSVSISPIELSGPISKAARWVSSSSYLVII